MKILNNFVHILPDPPLEKYKDSSIFIVDAGYNPEQLQINSGKVLEIPQSLICDKEHPKTMKFDVPIEIQKGDHAWFRWNSIDAAKKDGRVLDDGTVLIKYDELYVAKRGEQIICLNGFCILKPIKEKLKSKYIIFTEKAEKERHRGILTHKGAPVSNYVFMNYADPPDDEFNIGDTMIVWKNAEVNLEAESMERWGERIWVVQRKNMASEEYWTKKVALRQPAPTNTKK